MGEPLDELYFKWLYRQVASDRLKDPTRTYWSLLRLLYSKEFVWFVPNDDNRVEDGRDLRYEFVKNAEIEEPDHDWLNLGCSFLEMLIALSKRCAFEDEGNYKQWFWHLIDNLNLGAFCDAHFRTKKQQYYVDEVMETVIWRNYRGDGRGGLFPLHHPEQDQREIEIWYQLSCYLLEGHGV